MMLLFGKKMLRGGMAAKKARGGSEAIELCQHCVVSEDVSREVGETVAVERTEKERELVVGDG